MLCFIDLDGVLVDFVQGAFDYHDINIPWPEIQWDFLKQAGIEPDAFWTPLDQPFWASLKPTSELFVIIPAAERKFGVENVFLCSSPCETAGCITGKAMWVEKHLPSYSRRLILTNRKEVFSGPGRVLIDDRDENVEGWEKAGGIGVLVPRPWNKTKASRRNVSTLIGEAIDLL